MQPYLPIALASVHIGAAEMFKSVEPSHCPYTNPEHFCSSNVYCFIYEAIQLIMRKDELLDAEMDVQ
jgi:hypothetical protein